MKGKSLPQAASLTQQFTDGLRLSGPEGLEALSAAADMVAINPDRFRAVMHSADFGSIRVNRLRTSAVSGIRAPDRLADDHSVYLSMVCVRTGEMRIRQNRVSGCVGAGQIAFVDFAAPFEVELSHHGDYVFVYLPHDLLVARSVDSRTLVGAAVPASPLGDTIAAAIEKFAATDVCAPGSAEAALIERAILDLCLAVIHQSTGDTQVRDEIGIRNRARAREFVESNFTDPRLTIAQVASSINVSPRYLQKLFEAEEYSVYELIRRRRVRWGVALLTDPGAAHLTISQVALRSGFVGLSQFSRAVRDITGTSPRGIRQQAELSVPLQVSSGSA
ncbi:helix-turn-helix domain-containing protein [Rhodococcus sp. UNC363MFTsu5.1]|uniref:helix-turn-helix domain-containing protein n=1 Tax=Rhodococcus sp. UNC363MFTsu5.1 TaxID=1449069 RepID=UPI0009DD4A08|nr:helix-turn-helix domain-containing protein [Rhodococcus sp. UNC363MFTsu5.1]